MHSNLAVQLGKSPAPEIRLLAVNDQSPLRASLAGLLRDREHVRIVGTCASSQEAVALLNLRSLDLILIDGGPVLIGRGEERQQRRVYPLLNARQHAILEGVCDGLTNKEIAWRQGISESAVKAALQRLFERAGVRTRSQLVRAAIEAKNPFTAPSRPNRL